jgi:tetratricopeptide (TPR) repeat protein
VATSLNNFAPLYRARHRYSQSEALLKRALAIWEKTLGMDHAETASSLNNLADVYRLERRFADAEPLYRRALAIKEKALGPEHPTWLRA